MILSVTITIANVLSTLIHRVSERRGARPPDRRARSVRRSAASFTASASWCCSPRSASRSRRSSRRWASAASRWPWRCRIRCRTSSRGIHLLADKPIRVGDYVKVADTVEGHVEDIGWRSTRVRMLQNVVVTIPEQAGGRVDHRESTTRPSRGSRCLFASASTTVPTRTWSSAFLVEEANRAVGEVPGLRRGARADGATHPGFRRALPRLHARLPGQLVHGPVRRPARAPKAHPPSSRGRGSPDPRQSL